MILNTLLAGIAAAVVCFFLLYVAWKVLHLPGDKENIYAVLLALLGTVSGLYYWIPIRLNRRQLHMLQPSKGGKRRPQGGTRSYDLKRGTLVDHPDHGLTYVGGMQRKIERVSLHDVETGKRLTQSANIPDLRVLTTISWRAQFLPATSSGVSLRKVL